MKIKSFCLCFVAILFSSCVPVATYVPLKNQITPSAFPTLANSPMPTVTPVTPTLVPETPSSLPESTTGFIEPDPETYVMVMPAVLEYFYYRKKTMISGNVEELWTQYPELRNAMDIPKGINAEGFFISNYQGLKLFDGNIFPEEYERIRVKVKIDEIEVLVHGMELYLFLDTNGLFNESGGEIKIVLSLLRKDGRWSVFKTDEVMQSEWQEFSP